jgi:phosphatidate cytidylyltransferase
MTELAKRISVAMFGIPVLIATTYLGGWYFFAVILIISTVAQWEFYDIQKEKSIFPQRLPGITLGTLLLIGVQLKAWPLSGFLLTAGIMLLMITEMFRRYTTVSANLGVTILGILYIPFFLGCLLYIRDFLDTMFPQIPDAGFRFVLTMFVTIWICDTFAYGFGRKIGHHKLYQKVSPNKTIEGGIAGVIGSLLVLLLVKETGILPLTWFQAIAFGLVFGIIGQLGDLVESWFKRDAGVKDSSAILPGHGGMLDRFDSIIFVSPVLLLLTRTFWP